MLSFLIAFFVCLVLTPFVIRFATRRKLFDIPDERKIHDDEIPRLGGVAIISAVLISILLSADADTIFDMRYFLAGLLILFFVGLWDDLQPIKPIVKLAGEVIPIALLAWSARIPLPILSEFGMDTGWLLLLEWSFTFFIAFWIINAFNLIDGINGLAGAIGLILMASYALTIPFYHQTLSLAMCGALLAFLFFNFRSPRIFMGDCGSLLIGYCAVFIMTGADSSSFDYHPMGSFSKFLNFMLTCFIAPAAVPLFDMARVFIIRVAKGKNPFHGDRNHLHHLLLETGMQHTGATLTLSSLTLVNTIAIYSLVFTCYGAPLYLLAGILPLVFTGILWQRVRKIRQHA